MKNFLLMAALAAVAPFAGEARQYASFDVVPRMRYMLSYKWATTNFPDVAAGPLGQWNVFNNRSALGPVQELEFLPRNADGSRTRQFQPLLSGDAGEWRHEFYVPDGKTNMTLSVGSDKKKGQDAWLTDIRLEEVTNAPTLNVNPDFALGPYNYAGIAGVNTAAEAVMLENPNGGNSFYAGAGFWTTSTPVTGGRRYRVAYTGWGSTSKSYINPQMTFSGGGTTLSVDLPRVTADADDPYRPMTKYCDFVAPEGATWVRFSFYYATLDSLRLTSLERAPSMVFLK